MGRKKERMGRESHVETEKPSEQQRPGMWKWGEAGQKQCLR